MTYLVKCHYRAGDPSGAYSMSTTSRWVTVEAECAHDARMAAIDAIYAYDPNASHVSPGSPIMLPGGIFNAS